MWIPKDVVLIWGPALFRGNMVVDYVTVKRCLLNTTLNISFFHWVIKIDW